jgi:serine/threonine protein kinase
MFRPNAERPLVQLTKNLLDTYKHINEVYYAQKRARRASETAASQWDDQNHDLIINVGDVFAGRYKVRAKIGRGSFGQVVKAQDKETSDMVAIKVIKAKRAFRKQGGIELELLDKLSEADPDDAFGVVRIKGSFEWRGHLCVITELLSINLYDLLRTTQFRGLSLALVRKFARQLLTTLMFLRFETVSIIHCVAEDTPVLVVEDPPSPLIKPTCDADADADGEYGECSRARELMVHRTLERWSAASAADGEGSCEHDLSPTDRAVIHRLRLLSSLNTMQASTCLLPSDPFGYGCCARRSLRVAKATATPAEVAVPPPLPPVSPLDADSNESEQDEDEDASSSCVSSTACSYSYSSSYSGVPSFDDDDKLQLEYLLAMSASIPPRVSPPSLTVTHEVTNVPICALCPPEDQVLKLGCLSHGAMLHDEGIPLRTGETHFAYRPPSGLRSNVSRVVAVDPEPVPLPDPTPVTLPDAAQSSADGAVLGSSKRTPVPIVVRTPCPHRAGRRSVHALDCLPSDFDFEAPPYSPILHPPAAPDQPTSTDPDETFSPPLRLLSSRIQSFQRPDERRVLFSVKAQAGAVLRATGDHRVLGKRNGEVAYISVGELDLATDLVAVVAMGCVAPLTPQSTSSAVRLAVARVAGWLEGLHVSHRPFCHPPDGASFRADVDLICQSLCLDSHRHGEVPMSPCACCADGTHLTLCSHVKALATAFHIVPSEMSSGSPLEVRLTLEFAAAALAGLRSGASVFDLLSSVNRHCTLREASPRIAAAFAELSCHPYPDQNPFALKQLGLKVSCRYDPGLAQTLAIAGCYGATLVSRMTTVARDPRFHPTRAIPEGIFDPYDPSAALHAALPSFKQWAEEVELDLETGAFYSMIENLEELPGLHRVVDLTTVSDVHTFVTGGIVSHNCDIKPENILLRSSRRSAIKMIDFGSSCNVEERLYAYIQSRFYRAPEVLLGLSYGFPVDMWSLGCVLAELHTGRPLFAGSCEGDQLLKIIEYLGMPPDEMLEAGAKTPMYARKVPMAAAAVIPNGSEPAAPAPTRWELLPGAENATRRHYPAADVMGSPPHLLRRDFSSLLGTHTGGPRGAWAGHPGHSPVDYSLFEDLLHKILQYRPEDRITPEAALQHPFFTGVQVPEAAALPAQDLPILPS